MLALGVICASVAAATLSPTADRPQYICLNSVGGGRVPTQAMITSTLANLSGVQRSRTEVPRGCVAAHSSPRLHLALLLFSSLPRHTSPNSPWNPRCTVGGQEAGRVFKDCGMDRGPSQGIYNNMKIM